MLWQLNGGRPHHAAAATATSFSENLIKPMKYWYFFGQNLIFLIKTNEKSTYLLPECCRWLAGCLAAWLPGCLAAWLLLLLLLRLLLLLFASICSPGPRPPEHGWRSTICQYLLARALATGAWLTKHYLSGFAWIYLNLLQFTGICWDLLGFAGICWDLLEFAGICWDLLAFASRGVGHRSMADEALFAWICSPQLWPPNHGWRSTIWLHGYLWVVSTSNIWHWDWNSKFSLLLHNGNVFVFKINNSGWKFGQNFTAHLSR